MVLTSSDKSWIKNVLQDGLDSQEEKFEAKIVEVKSDFLDKIDPILKEVAATREERTILSQHSKDQTEGS